MTEVLKRLEKRKYSEDTCIENSDTDGTIILDSDSESDSKKIRCTEIRRKYSFKEKVLIMKELETQRKVIVSKNFGVNRCTLRKWLLKREEIENAYEKETIQNLNKNKTIANEDVEDALYKWFLQARENGILFSETILKNKALTLNKELGGKETFEASGEWLRGWKQRKKVRIGLPKITRERFPRELDAWNKYKMELANVLNDKQLTRAQVFGLDTTGFSYKTLPTKVIKGNKIVRASQTKRGKLRDRVTIGACSNADGSLKLRLIVVGRSAYPNAIKSLSKERLPVCYRNENNSLMDASVFENWFKTEFLPTVRVFLTKKKLPFKALLIINNCDSRGYKSLKIGNFETMFLPPNVTSIIHPEDKTIVETLKTDSKLRLVKSVFNAQENDIRLRDHLRTITIREMIFWISTAWDEISSATVYKLWTKIWPVETEIYVTETRDIKTTPLVSVLPVRIDSEETVINAKNDKEEEILDVLRCIRGYENLNTNIIRDWITAVEDWEDEKKCTDSKNNKGTISIRNAEEEISPDETNFTYHIL